MKISGQKVSKVTTEPQVYKEQEYAVFLGLVAEGAWKNDRYLARVCNVDRTTIADWKKRGEVIRLNQEVNKHLLSKWKKIGRVEDLLKEQEMEFDPEKQEVKMIVEVSNLPDV